MAQNTNKLPIIIFIEHLMEQRSLWRQDPLYGFVACPMKMQCGSPNYFIWECTIPGEDNTPWRHARYQLTLTFITQKFLPMVRFHVPLFHPNVDQLGYMNYEWKDVVGEPHNIKDTLTTIQRILSRPDLDDDSHLEARDMFISKPDSYYFQARLQALKILEDEESLY